MYAIDELYFPKFLLCIILTGVILITSFFMLEFYKSNYFSGFPYINKKAKKSLTYMKKVICFWVLGKIVEISICIYLLITSTLSNEQLSHYLEGNSLLGYSLYVIYALSLIITELIPGRFVLEKRFLYIFKGDANLNAENGDVSLEYGNDGVDVYKSMVGTDSDPSSNSNSTRKVTQIK